MSFIFLAFICILKDYTGSLPWLAAMASFPWATYGASQIYYYKKSLAENTKDGIKFESMISSRSYQGGYSNNSEDIDINGPI